jgi:hypothetical protein
LPVAFLWGESEQLVQGAGITYDISASSVFVRTEQCPPLNTEFWLRITLPLQKADRTPHLEGTGVVVRAVDGGFAALTELAFSTETQEQDKSTSKSVGPSTEKRSRWLLNLEVATK